MDGQTSWGHEWVRKNQTQIIRTEKDKGRRGEIKICEKALSGVKEVKAVNWWNHGKIRLKAFRAYEKKDLIRLPYLRAITLLHQPLR